jgi:maltooligosyltrehalose trehalohydrolase
LTPDPLVAGDLGAHRLGARDWSFLVWAPGHGTVSVRIYAGGQETDHALEGRENGYFVGVVRDLGDAPDYRFVLADGTVAADPASRWQPDGVHGSSRGFDPSTFSWAMDGHLPRPLTETVIYELHVGTFTPAGTFDTAIGRLDDLVALGVTAVEPMPIGAFPGVRNWGYDGVFPFAAQDSYGGPVGFQRFVDACHQRGLAVILDVVYNHLGPEGNVLGSFGPYFTDVYSTPWGAAVNVSEAGSDEVRRYFIENALMWLRDFRVDGLRLDAIHGIVDPTASPFLRELTQAVDRLASEVGRSLTLIAESADNNPAVVSPALTGGLGFAAQWNDDFHHPLHVALTGEHDGYYADYTSLDDLARAFNDGFVFQGEHSEFRGRRHGAPSRSVPRDHFVVFAQDHDQIGNRAGAERLSSLVTPPAARLAAAVVLLSPFVPMLFMGEEYAERAPFPYFIDHGDPDLVEAVRQGRAEEFGRDADELDPASEATYAAATLDWAQRDRGEGGQMLDLYGALIAARRELAVLTDPEVLESDAVATSGVLTLARRSTTSMAFMAFNFNAAPTELSADVSAQRWQRVLDSAEGRFGGDGVALPAELGAAEPLTLPAFGFCLYVATPEGTA